MLFRRNEKKGYALYELTRMILKTLLDSKQTWEFMAQICKNTKVEKCKSEIQEMIVIVFVFQS
jgi:hypothetical protein